MGLTAFASRCSPGLLRITGVLLLPLGLSTYWAARSLSQAWAVRQCVVSTITTLSLPVLLVATMPRESLRAIPFLVAVVAVFLACSAQILALLGFVASRRH